MGLEWRREVVAVRCEVRSCRARKPFTSSGSSDSTWHDHVGQLDDFVGEGWAIVLNAQLRSYCPDHAQRAAQCSCRRHRNRVNLCPVHGPEGAALLWDSSHIPFEVSTFLKVAS